MPGVFVYSFVDDDWDYDAPLTCPRDDPYELNDTPRHAYPLVGHAVESLGQPLNLVAGRWSC